MVIDWLGGVPVQCDAGVLLAEHACFEQFSQLFRRLYGRAVLQIEEYQHRFAGRDAFVRTTLEHGVCERHRFCPEAEHAGADINGAGIRQLFEEIDGELIVTSTGSAPVPSNDSEESESE